MRTKLTLSARLAAALLCCLLLALPVLAAGETAGETVSIRSAADFLRFAEQCSYDAWSRNKTVVLERDVSLSGVDYLPAASFSGTFDGRGHTISGLELTAEVSPAGLFGTVERAGTVRNLTVTGSVSPEGEARQVGGIAGLNRGSIADCAFSGTVRGENMTGGIAGENDATGWLRRCSVTGGVFGKRMTGGVAGNSSGTVSACSSRAFVNTDTMDPAVSLTDLNLDLGDTLRRLSSPDTYNVATDSGGIAGHSDGVLSACRNYGTVGYQHLGYNVGGIVGRSSGLVSGCTNYGSVYGRRDVGGVAGVAEPYVVLRLTGSTLETVREELRALSGLVDRTAADASGSSAAISARLTAIGDSVDSLEDRTMELGTELGTDLRDTANGAIGEINRTGQALNGALPILDDAAGDLRGASASLTEGLAGLDTAMGEADAEPLKRAIAEAQTAANMTDRGMEAIQEGLAGLRGTISPREGLSQAEWMALIYGTDRGGVHTDGAMDQIQNGLSDLTVSLTTLRKTLESLKAGIADGSITTARQVYSILAEAQAVELLRTAAGGLPQIAEGLEIIAENSDFSDQAARSALQTVRQGLAEISGGPGGGMGAFDHLSNALGALGEMTADSQAGFAELRKSVEALTEASARAETALGDMRRLLSYLEGQEPPALPALGGNADASAQALRESMTRLSGELEQLNGELSGASEQLVGDVQRLNAQFTVLMETLMGAVEDVENLSLSDKVEDASDEDVDAVVSGKLLRCVNEGTVYGDINVGGVAGSMSVYNALNPEGDGQLDLSAAIRRTYQLKCVLQNCRNNGSVTAKRNNVGAVCGEGSLGVVSGCLACGSAESQEGGYVGGIAGRGDNILRRCWSRCTLTGLNRVGGVVGAASEDNPGLLVDGCVSLVDLRSDGPYTGAVSGGSQGSFSGNRFVSDSLGGINRVSLEGRAEPVSYAALLETEDLPEVFRSFTLTFLAEGQTVRRQTFAYGDSFDAAQFPPIPAREGMYGVWDRQDLRELHLDTVVTAVYSPSLTALASDATRAGGLPVCFALGAFTDQDRLIASPAIVDFTPQRGNLWQSLKAYRRTLLEQWELTLSPDGAEEHTFRYLPAAGSGSVELYLSDGGGTWTRVETENFGSYLSFTAPGAALYLTVLTTATPWWVWVLAAVFVLAALGLLAALLIRRRTKKDGGEDEAVRAARFRRCRRRARLILLAAVVVIGGAAAAVLHFAPELESREAASLLQNYAERSASELYLHVSVQNGGEAHETAFVNRTAACAGKRVASTDLYGIPLYRCEDVLLLSDGAAFRAEASFPDGQTLLRAAAEAMRDTGVTVTEQNDEKTCRTEVTGQRAGQLLRKFLPGLEAGVPEPEALALELTVLDGQPSALTALWSGPDSSVRAGLDFPDGGEPAALPAAVEECVSSGAYAGAADAAPEIQALLGAWLELFTRNPLSAELRQTVNCGPVLADEALLWQAVRYDGKPVSVLTRGDAVQYVHDGKASNADGSPVSGGGAAEVDALLGLVLETALKGEPVREADGALAFSLDGRTLDAFAAVLAPRTVSQNPTWREGVLRLTLAGGGLERVYVQTRGAVSVAQSDVPAQISAELAFRTGLSAPEAPAAVAEALGL